MTQRPIKKVLNRLGLKAVILIIIVIVAIIAAIIVLVKSILLN